MLTRQVCDGTRSHPRPCVTHISQTEKSDSNRSCRLFLETSVAVPCDFSALRKDVKGSKRDHRRTKVDCFCANAHIPGQPLATIILSTLSLLIFVASVPCTVLMHHCRAWDPLLMSYQTLHNPTFLTHLMILVVSQTTVTALRSTPKTESITKI